MKYLIIKDAQGYLIRFAKESEETKIPEMTPPCQVILAEVLEQITLNYDKSEDTYLSEVCFSDGSRYFVHAFSWSDALVTAALFSGKRQMPTTIFEYDLYRVKNDGISLPATHIFDEELNPLIARLTEGNCDLVAHCLEYVAGIDEDVLRSDETDSIRRILGVDGKTGLDLSAEEIKRVCSYIWNNYLLFEATGALLPIFRLHGKHSGDTNIVSLLLWTYIFEQWAHYDCQLSYTLYRLLLDGGFDRHLPEFLLERDILG